MQHSIAVWEWAKPIKKAPHRIYVIVGAIIEISFVAVLKDQQVMIILILQIRIDILRTVDLDCFWCC